MSPTCEPFGGQCPCRGHVIGRDCSRCATGYWGFPNCRREYPVLGGIRASVQNPKDSLGDGKCQDPGGVVGKRTCRSLTECVPLPVCAPQAAWVMNTVLWACLTVTHRNLEGVEVVG